MARRLPSLNALKVFEAAARHLSFTRAAAELCITQGAISQQVKLLEGQLKAQLFKRAGRRLLLTDAGQDLARGIGEALDGLSRCVERVSRRDEAGPLTVTMMPSFAATVLVPRLGHFLAAHPDIDLRLHTSYEVMDLRASGIDIAIRHGAGRYPGLHVEALAHEHLFPVCAPAMAAHLARPTDLRHVALIRDHDIEWSAWLAAAGVPEIEPHGPSFLDTHLALQAAVDGQGVTLGRSLVAAEHLKAGRLVRPFALSIPAPLAYWVVCLTEHADHPRVRAFRDWLFTEIGDMAAGMIIELW